MNSETVDLPSRIRICAGLAGNGEILAKEAAINRRTLETYISGQAEPKISKIVAIAKAVGVSIDWLATGEGEMRPDGSGAQRDKASNAAHLLAFEGADGVKTVPLEDSGQADRGRMGEIFHEDFALVPVYDVQASAGHGCCVESEQQTGKLAFRKDWLRDKGLKIKNLAIITAVGDSMEPTLSDGDIMLVDTSVDRIIDGAIYIVQADHHLLVKRIQQNLDGSLIIISDNQRYKEQTISPEQAKDVKIAGRVKWYGHEI